LFMKGTKADRVSHHMCQPRDGTDVKKDLDSSNYGYGVYLSDASDKMDQYAGEAGLGFTELQNLLDSKHVDRAQGLVDLQELQEHLNSTVDDIFLAGVQRVYMGKHIELQIEYQGCFKNEAHKDREIMWYYRDPWNSSERDVAIHDDPKNNDDKELFDRQPPFEEWDSIKVMTTAFNPEFSENICPGASLSPNRHNEFVVPREDQAANQYIVAYARKWDEEHPAKPQACVSREGGLTIPRPPRRPRLPCSPCSDGWKYDGFRGRLQPGQSWQDQPWQGQGLGDEQLKITCTAKQR